jgi:hypothetical protein
MSEGFSGGKGKPIPALSWSSILLGATGLAIGIGLISWAASVWQIDGEKVAQLASERSRDLIAQSVAQESDAAFDFPRTLYGYYGDLDREGKNTSISRETYRLQFAKASPVVRGEASGPVTAGGRKVQRTWKLAGFHRDPRLVLDILGMPSQNDPKANGIGAYVLTKSGADYTGTAVYLDCAHGMVQCPYALTSDDLSDTQARARWPELFSRSCEKIDLAPGQPGNLSC